MTTHSIKKNIRLLCERYDHSIEYSAEDLLIKSDLNWIKISPKSKYGFVIKYNTKSTNIQIEIRSEDIYDVLIEILTRPQLYELKAKTGKLLELNDWITEEGSGIAKELKTLKATASLEKVDFKNIGGNRLEGEYFKGIIILTDDLRWDKSNVFELNSIDL